jgi:hypothetical protein
MYRTCRRGCLGKKARVGLKGNDHTLVTEQRLMHKIDAKDALASEYVRREERR